MYTTEYHSTSKKCKFCNIISLVNLDNWSKWNNSTLKRKILPDSTPLGVYRVVGHIA